MSTSKVILWNEQVQKIDEKKEENELDERSPKKAKVGYPSSHIPNSFL